MRGGDLNILDKFNQTPLAYSTMNTLKKLSLENGVTFVKPEAKLTFDNN